MFILPFNKKEEICPFKAVNEILYFNVFGMCRKFVSSKCCIIFAGSLEAAYSLNWGAQKIWGKGGGETLALL